MEKERKGKGRFDKWFTLIFYLYPFAMIGAYYIGWNTLFYIGVIPIFFLSIVNIYGKFKYANWLTAVLPIIYFVVFSEIGYLITKNILDGVCMGCYVSIIIGTVEIIFRKFREKKVVPKFLII